VRRLGTSLEHQPGRSLDPATVHRRPGARRETRADRERQARRGACQTSPATLLTAIDLRCTSGIPGIGLTLTCAATGRGSSTATTPAHPMLLVMEMIAGLQVGHLPNPIFERDRIRLPSATPPRGDKTAEEVSHLHSNPQRLTAQT
jgi:hypothetical protein